MVTLEKGKKTSRLLIAGGGTGGSLKVQTKDIWNLWFDMTKLTKAVLNIEDTMVTGMGQVNTNIPVLDLIQTNIVWSTNAGFLLPPLPLHQLLLH